MDITPPPGAHGSPDGDRMSGINGDGNNSLNVPNPAIGAAAAAQQPKVVQTAFIHKLYKYVPRSALAAERQAYRGKQHVRRSRYSASHFLVRYKR
jgi:hypothetical protein